MSDDPIAADAADLLSDLIFMRKSAGFTAGRIVNAGTLRHVLGGADAPYNNLRDRFVSAIQSLLDPEPELLLAAYGLDPAYNDVALLRDRRAQYGATVGRKLDTIADREDAALEHLRVQLLSGWYTQSPLPVKLPEMHNGTMQEYVHVSMLLRDKKWVHTKERYRFVALFDEAEYIAISTSYDAMPIAESPFTVKTVRVGSGYSHRFYHVTPMVRGTTYDLRFTLRPDAEHSVSKGVAEISRAFHERTLVATIEVQFEGERPNVIWGFEGLTFFERPGDPTRSNQVVLGADGRGRVTGRDLYGGLFSGMSWRWALKHEASQYLHSNIR